MVAWGEGSVAGRGRYESPPCLPDLSKRSKPPVSRGRHEEASGTESLHCGSSEGTGRWVVAHFPPHVCIFIWRQIPSEIISQPEPGVVFEHSLLHSKLECPDLSQLPKCLPVPAVDRHQGNVTKSDQKGVYRAHRGP
jgi:hypothetical protein